MQIMQRPAIINYTCTPAISEGLKAHMLKANQQIPTIDPFEDTIDYIGIQGAFCSQHTLVLVGGELIITILIGTGHCLFWSLSVQRSDSSSEQMGNGCGNGADFTPGLVDLKRCLTSHLPNGAQDSKTVTILMNAMGLHIPA